MRAEEKKIREWMKSTGFKSTGTKVWNSAETMPPHMKQLGYVVPPHLQPITPPHLRSDKPIIPPHLQKNQLRSEPNKLPNEQDVNMDESMSDMEDNLNFEQLNKLRDVFTVDEYGIHVTMSTKTIRFWNTQLKGYELLLKSTTINNENNKFESKFNTKISVKANGGAADFNKWFNIFGVDLMQHEKIEIERYFPKENDNINWSPIEAILQFKKAMILDVLSTLLKK